MGAFGLVAAIGLGSLERVRQARLQRSHDQALQAHVERGLARHNEHSATIDSINSAVRKLARQAAIDKCGTFGKPLRNRRRDQLEMLADYPLEIMPIDEQAEFDAELPSFSGVLQNISSCVVSFKHTESISTRTVLLTFQLGQGRLSFVVDVTSTRQIDGGHSSDGTVLAVGVPSHIAEPAVAG